MKKHLIILLSLCWCTSILAQGYGRKKKDAFPQQPRYEKKSFYFGLGGTYTLPILNKKQVDGAVMGDTTYTADLSQKGQFGLAAELGRYHMINNLYFFRYWNYGINYRWLKGQEDYSKQLTSPAQTIDLGSGQNTFSNHFINAHIEINGANKLSDNTFLQHSFGASGGYAITSKQAYTTGLPGLQENSSSKIHAYAYYKIGFGARVSKKLIIIPSVEVPLLNGYSFNNGRFDMPYFNSNYWPLTFSIRFFLCKPYRLKDCPPVDAIGLPEGFDPNEPNK